MKQINISGIIGWDATANQLRDDLQAANGEDCEILFSTPGGLVGEGLEMFNLIKNYPGRTTAVLSGYVMSMGSYLVRACNHRRAEANAVYMIHNAGGGVCGDHNEVLGYGRYLQGLSAMIAKAYAAGSGKELAEITAMMDQETYFFGDQIQDHGFAEEMIPCPDQQPDPDPASARSRAKAAMERMQSAMVADVLKVKNDLTRAMAMASPASPKPQQEKPMNLTELKQKHPELVTALAEEIRATMTATVDQANRAGQQAGAEQERQRIIGVRAQSIPGHEALIEAMAMDGKSTAADAAMAIVAAENNLRRVAAQALGAEHHPVVTTVDAGHQAASAASRQAADLPTEEQAKANWDASAALRSEFGDYDCYLAFFEKEQEGLVKILGKKG